jgi:Metallo-peptidase family M12
VRFALISLIAIVLLALALAGGLIAGCERTTSQSSFREALRHQYIKHFDIENIKRRADNREPFIVQLGDNDVAVQVKPNAVWSDGCSETDRNAPSSQRPCDPRVRTYSGRTLIEGVRTQVRLTIGKDGISGYVRDGRDWWFIEPLRKFQPSAQPGEHLIYNAADVIRRTSLRHDTRRPSARVPSDDRVITQDQGASAVFRMRPLDDFEDPADDPSVPDDPASPPPLDIIELHLLADSEFVAAATGLGRGTLDEQVALVNNVDGIYRKSVGITFRIVSSTSDSIASPCLTGTTSSSLFDQILPCFSTFNPAVTLAPNQIVHLMSGKVLEAGFLGFGRIRGVANRPGQDGLSTHRLGVVAGSSFGVPDLAFEDLMVVAHEIGHNLDGCHAEADRWCAAHFWGICFSGRNTIMWPIVSGDNQRFFSSGGRDFTDNNHSRIRFNLSSRPFGTMVRVCPED